MQAASDIFLGWVTVTGVDGEERCFYVRQMWDGKGSADVEALTAAELATYGALCGRTLARAHARSGDRIAIASYLGGGGAFDKALAEFAEFYADRNESDFEQVREAVDSGRIAVAEASP
jgi:predicted alpha/beta hydrolase